MVETKKLLPDKQILDDAELESVVGGAIPDEVARGLCQLVGSLVFSISALDGYRRIVNPNSNACLRFLYGLNIVFMGIDSGAGIGGFLYDVCKQKFKKDSKESESSKKLEN